MKVLKEKYPKGTFKSQKSDGRYIDKKLYDNLTILARSIVNDMTFLSVCFSSTLEVGTGKSVFCTQIGETWCEIMNEMHGTNLEFTQYNIVFHPKDLIDRAFKVPKHSFLLLDEWEDAHYWSELGMTLRKFFRKCRQLNLFIMIVIPNFFQLPLNYAVSRSVFALDVKFEANFTRGFFDFYSFKRKKNLYIMGKKTQNYGITQPNFQGRFFDGYGIPEQAYRKAKYEDMVRWDVEEKALTPKQIRNDMIKKLNGNGLAQNQIADLLGISKSNISKIILGKYDAEGDQLEDVGTLSTTYNINNEKEVDYSEAEAQANNNEKNPSQPLETSSGALQTRATPSHTNRDVESPKEIKVSEQPIK